MRPNCWKSIISVELYKINIISTSFVCSRASYHRFKVRTIRLRMCSTRSYSNNIFSTKRSGYRCYRVNLACRSQDKFHHSNNYYRNKGGELCSRSKIQLCFSQEIWMYRSMTKASGRSFYSNKTTTQAIKLNKRVVRKPTPNKFQLNV